MYLILHYLKAPEPVEPWNHLWNAYEHGRICIQPGNPVQQPFPHNEDCLTLNIYVPGK